ncbi:MAG: GNAT family N-acetyltransferase [Acidimicrobiales bacterium]
MIEPTRTLRNWRPADAPALMAAWTDADVAAWNPVPPTPSIDIAERWINGVSNQTSTADAADRVLVDDAGNVLGEVGLQLDRRRSIAELGFWVATTARRRGVGADLLGRVPALLTELGVERAFAMVDPQNGPALALMERSGWIEVHTTGDRRGFMVEAL